MEMSRPPVVFPNFNNLDLLLTKNVLRGEGNNLKNFHDAIILSGVILRYKFGHF